MQNKDFADFMEKTRTLFLAVVDQALDDIRDYHLDVNEVTKAEYVDALEYFHNGGEYDRWIGLLDLNDDRRFKWLKRCITAIPIPRITKPKPTGTRKPYVRTKKVVYTCLMCGKTGESYGTNRVYCDECRRKRNCLKVRRWREGQHTTKRREP